MSLRRVHSPAQAQPLYGLTATRALEAKALARSAPGQLMRQAGQSVARLALALAPHAQTIVVLCGPGNNGGDGLIAAAELHQSAANSGRRVLVTLTHGAPKQGDAALAWAAAHSAGVQVISDWPSQVDMVIDAVFGIGVHLPLDATTLGWLSAAQAAPVRLSVDAPSDLDCSTGQALTEHHPHAQVRHTLSLLTLKPGLFTGHGRDLAGSVWWDDLGCADLPLTTPPDAWLAPPALEAQRAHTMHKGSFGDVTVIGGQLPEAGRTGMLGAAVLASRAALHAGAGRVYLCTLGDAWPSIAPAQADLMLRTWATLQHNPAQGVWLAGCGGGSAIAALMPHILQHPDGLILDADALNAVAADVQLQNALRTRKALSVLTPHPLEAARLLGCATAQVQANRLLAAQALADRYQAVVVLKGSGTVIAAPALSPWVNPTGNARLAIAGTGDVLAGMVAARLARGDASSMAQAQTAVAEAVWRHGHLADQWPLSKPLTAQALANLSPG